MFADANCTEYADGEVTEVYVRINGGPYEFGDSLRLGTGENSLVIGTPTTENPTDPYSIICYMLLVSDDLDGPIEPGTIVRCHSEFSTDCTNFRKIWYGGE